MILAQAFPDMVALYNLVRTLTFTIHEIAYLGWEALRFISHRQRVGRVDRFPWIPSSFTTIPNLSLKELNSLDHFESQFNVACRYSMP